MGGAVSNRSTATTATRRRSSPKGGGASSNTKMSQKQRLAALDKKLIEQSLRVASQAKNYRNGNVGGKIPIQPQPNPKTPGKIAIRPRPNPKRPDIADERKKTPVKPYPYPALSKYGTINYDLFRRR